jgi:S-adenosylmethionine synthetase
VLERVKEWKRILKNIFNFKAKKHKLEDVSIDVATLVSHATQEYLRNILEKLNTITQHRIDLSLRVIISSLTTLTLQQYSFLFQDK